MVKTRQGEEERGKWGQINIKYIQINLQTPHDDISIHIVQGPREQRVDAAVKCTFQYHVP